MYTVSEDMGRWLKNHPAATLDAAQAIAREIHARRDRPLEPALVYIVHPDGKSERV